MLLRIVEVYGARNWERLADLIPGRNGKQCRDRFLHHLSPTVKKHPWTEQEDGLILCMMVTHGHNWARMARYLPGRTHAAVANRYHQCLKTKLRRCGESFLHPTMPDANIAVSTRPDMNVACDENKNALAVSEESHALKLPDFKTVMQLIQLQP